MEKKNTQKIGLNFWLVTIMTGLSGVLIISWKVLEYRVYTTLISSGQRKNVKHILKVSIRNKYIVLFASFVVKIFASICHGFITL